MGLGLGLGLGLGSELWLARLHRALDQGLRRHLDQVGASLHRAHELRGRGVVEREVEAAPAEVVAWLGLGSVLVGVRVRLALTLTLALMWLPMRSVGASAPGRRLIINMHLG